MANKVAEDRARLERAEAFWNSPAASTLSGAETCAAFATSEVAYAVAAEKGRCCKAVCGYCGGVHVGVNPKPFYSEVYGGWFHAELSAKTEQDRYKTMVRCRAAAIRKEKP